MFNFRKTFLKCIQHLKGPQVHNGQLQKLMLISHTFLDREPSHTVLHMGQVFFVAAQEEKTRRKNIEWQRTFLPGREKTRDTVPIHDFYLQVIDSLFEQEVVAANKELVLQGLLGIGHLGSRMFYKILHFGGERYLHAQYFFK